jgi:hypothetical protein
MARANNTSDLGMDVAANVVHDADRLAAMAGGNTLGGLLLRFRESEQPQWARRIVLIEAARIVDRYKIGRGIACKVATQALIEFYSPHCPACGGARELVIDQVKVACDTCGGVGKRRWKDAERREVIGTYGRRIDDAMTQALRDYEGALSGYLGHAAAKLG